MATLTVTHSESLVLDGRNRSASKTFSITNIEEIYERTLTVPITNPTVLVAFDSNVEGTAVELPVANAKYIRITNADSANTVKIGVIGNTTNYQVTLSPGQSHVLGAAEDLMVAEADTDPDFGVNTMTDLRSIEAVAVSTAATVEVYIASTAS